VRSAGVSEECQFAAEAGWNAGPEHSLPWLPEEPDAGGHREAGSTLHGAVGPRSHQILVEENPDRGAAGNRIRRYSIRWRRALAVAVEEYRRPCAQELDFQTGLKRWRAISAEPAEC